MYDIMATFYNKYTEDIDYDKLASFVQKSFKRWGNMKTDRPIILDAACGTGSLTIKLFDKGYDMIGLDLSDEMLNVAREKACDNNSEILWICQDMSKMDLFGTIHGAVCATDGVNHITSAKALNRFFQKVSLFMEKGGVFVFDMLTPYYFENVIDGNVFCDEYEDGTCIWQGSYNKKSKRCTYDVTFFAKEEEELYRRYETCVVEKAITYDEIELILQNSGFEIKGIFSDLKFGKTTETDSRRYYVCTK